MTSNQRHWNCSLLARKSYLVKCSPTALKIRLHFRCKRQFAFMVALNCPSIALKSPWNCYRNDSKDTQKLHSNCMDILLILSSKNHQIALKLLWNCSKEILVLHWNCTRVSLNLYWYCPKRNLQIALKLLWNCSKDKLELHWNCTEIALEFHWNCIDIAQKYLKTALKLLQSCS